MKKPPVQAAFPKYAVGHPHTYLPVYDMENVLAW